jgi:hypothetical protein
MRAAWPGGSRRNHALTHSESTDAADTDRAVDELAKFWDAVNREDIGIVERVRVGLDSPPSPAVASLPLRGVAAGLQKRRPRLSPYFWSAQLGMERPVGTIWIPER